MTLYESSCCCQESMSLLCCRQSLGEMAHTWKPNDIKLCDKLLVILDSSLRVEVRAGSQIATMPLRRLLFILRLSSCWLQLPMRYISGTGVVGSHLQWWKQPVKWSGSGEFLPLVEYNTCMWKMVRFGEGGGVALGCWGEKHHLQLLDPDGRKPVLCTGKKAIGNNTLACWLVFVIWCVPNKRPGSTLCSFVSLVIKFVSLKDERTQKLLEESAELLLWCRKLRCRKLGAFFWAI